MAKEAKLYKISNRLGTFYIVATSFDEAANALRERLEKAEYGFSLDCEVRNIEHIATESFSYRDKTIQSFSDDRGNLILVR